MHRTLSESTRPHRVLLVAILFGIAVGGILWLSGRVQAADIFWGAVVGLALIPLTISVLLQLLRRRLGVDIIALLAMSVALLLGEYLAGAVVALMLTGGQALEAFAAGRARQELSALIERAPKIVHRYERGALTSPALASVSIGDRLLVKPGEIVPVDGVVSEGSATLDESAVTGESRSVARGTSEPVLSGTVNAGGPFDMIATASANESTYAAIVRLVQQAQASKAPFVRLADRYAIIFLPLTVGFASFAWWFSQDPVRALAVLVVATPCPLILAAPVAIVSGISRAAHRGIIVKGGGPLEALARSRVLLLDKTGTLTRGVAELRQVATFNRADPSELLRIAASLDQVSPHTHASAIVTAARRQGIALAFPSSVQEQSGDGIEGVVEGRRVRIGKASWILGSQGLPEEAARLQQKVHQEGGSVVFLALNGALEGAFQLEDPLRSEAPETVRALRESGIRRVVLVTGDHPEPAMLVGKLIQADRIFPECSPSDKVRVVSEERRYGPTVMVGDGVNDAPALASADVGVALGARGASASSEAADVVLTVDRLDRLVEALSIARRSRRIALQSVLVGMGLSVTAMIFAAAGFITPLAGALLQEGIDVLVIFNALRALGGGR